MKKKKHSVLAKIIKILFSMLGLLAVAVVALFGYLTFREYKPDEQEVLAIDSNVQSQNVPKSGDTLTIMSWNIGYGALGDNADFFMDGGSSVKTADKVRVHRNLSEMANVIREKNPDILFLQELDRNSMRSHHIDELPELKVAASLGSTDSSFAYNFKVDFIPYPIPPIGTVNSGIATFSKYSVDQAVRIQLPCPFSWPVRLANLKRCLLINRISIDEEHDLVLINLHLEAYDEGEGKVEQTRVLRQILEEEAAAGNYVIAGGDFNQTFSSVDSSMYPEQEGTWQCGLLDESEFTEEFSFYMDNQVPSCRSLDQPYVNADKENFQYYLIDGFIVSNNLKVDRMETVDLDFTASDHNPVILEVEIDG